MKNREDRDLKRLSRESLLEMLIERGREIDALQARLEAAEEAQRQAAGAQQAAEEELRAAQEALAEANARLFEAESNPQRPQEDALPAGSLAEAAMQAAGVLEAAQRAADDYLDRVTRRCEAQKAECERMEAECRERVQAMLAETADRCRQTERAAELAAQEKWSAAMQRMDVLHAQIAEMGAVFGNSEPMEN